MEKEKLPDRMPALGTDAFLDGNGASVKGFLEFCKRNTPLVISVTLATLFVYGIILFNIVIAGDNPACFDYDYYVNNLISVNRWAAAFLIKLFFIKESGIYASNFIAVLSIWLFSILFCYFIAVFTKNTNRRNGFIPAALIVSTYAVWLQYFTLFLQHKIQNMFICVTLISVYVLFDGFVSRNRMKIAISFILTVISFGIYQPFVVLFLCIVFIYFVLFQENSNLSSKKYAMLCLKLFIVFIIAFTLNSIIGKVIVSLLDVPASDYVTGRMLWNKSSIRTVIAGILAQGYVLTIGMIPFVHSLFSPIMLHLYGSDSAVFAPVTEMVFDTSRVIGNIFLLPVAIVFLVMILLNAKRQIPKGRRILYCLAGLGIPSSILFLVVVSGEVLGIRILYSLPFAAAFMFYYVASKQKMVLRHVLYCLILATAFYQAQVSQNYTELAVRDSDYTMNMAFDLDARIRSALGAGEKLPVAYIGGFDHPFKNQIRGRMASGISDFNFWSTSWMEFSNERNPILMNAYGFRYNVPTPEQMHAAYKASHDMPAYPLEGCVKNLGDVVVVKLGN